MLYDEYRVIPAIHYSALSSLLKHPKYIRDEFTPSDDEFEPTDSMILGSLVDCKIFTPSDTDNRFFVSDAAKPEAKLGLVTDAYLKLGGDWKLIEKPIAIEALNQIGWNRRWSDDARYKAFAVASADYLNIIASAGARTIVSEDTDRLANRLVSELLVNRFTADIFSDKTDGVQNNYQFGFVWDENGERIKMLADAIKIDYRNKIIYPYDLKVIGTNPLRFPETHFIKFNYFIQGALYHRGLNILTRTIPEFAGFVVDKFRFIVISPNFAPVVYTMGDEWQRKVNEGFTLYTGRAIPSLNQLISDYVWHREHAEFDYPQDVYNNQGIIELL